MIIAAACLMLAGSWLTGCSAKADDSNQEKNTVAAVSESAENSEKNPENSPIESLKENPVEVKIIEGKTEDGAESADDKAKDLQESSSEAPTAEPSKTAAENTMAAMTAVVKEIEDDRLLVSSRTDAYPGAFYVFFGDADVSGIKGGDEITILWNGVILETDPAQIYADAIEIE